MTHWRNNSSPPVPSYRVVEQTLKRGQVAQTLIDCAAAFFAFLLFGALAFSVASPFIIAFLMIGFD